MPPRRLCSALAAVQPTALELPLGVGPLALNRIRDNYGARATAAQKTRVGRGIGTGRGRKSGRGQKGKMARAGNHGYLNKDGGQTKLQKGLPKFGAFKPEREYVYINLDKLQDAINRGRLQVPEDRPLDVADLFTARLITLRTRHSGVRLLGRGHERWDIPLRIEVQLASQNAIDAIERAGGTVESVYYNQVNLRAKLKPHRFEAAPVGQRGGRMFPRPALPPPQLMRDIYLTERHRGYLRNLKVGDVVRPHEHPKHVDLGARQKPRYPGWAAADQQALTLGKPYIKEDGTVAEGDGVERQVPSRAIQDANPARVRTRPWRPGDRV